MVNDELHVVHARAAGLDVHKKHITATRTVVRGERRLADVRDAYVSAPWRPV